MTDEQADSLVGAMYGMCGALHSVRAAIEELREEVAKERFVAMAAPRGEGEPDGSMHAVTNKGRLMWTCDTRGGWVEFHPPHKFEQGETES